MKKQLFTGLALSGALVLSACGSSDAGTAVAPIGSGAPTSAPAASAEVSPSTVMSTVGSVETATLGTPPAPTSMDASMSMPSSSDLPSSSAASTSAPATVSLDEASISWMTSLCTGFSTLATEGQQLDDVEPETDPATYAAALTKVGDGFTALSAELGSIAAPTFTNGQAVATAVSGSLGKYGPELSAAGAELAGVNTGDAAAVKAAADKAEDAYDAFDDGMENSFEGLDELSDAEQQAIAQIPACGPLFN